MKLNMASRIFIFAKVVLCKEADYNFLKVGKFKVKVYHLILRSASDNATFPAKTRRSNRELHMQNWPRQNQWFNELLRSLNLCRDQ